MTHQTPTLAPPKLNPADFQALATLMHQETGVLLPNPKLTMVEGRLAKRLRALGLDDFATYRAIVESRTPEGEQERALMLEALTTNVTRFNREPHHFETLRRAVLPALAERLRRGGRARLWSAACSSGEEPYSMGLSVLAAVPDAPRLDIRVLATDINANMVERGRRGIYPREALRDVDPAERERWFPRREDGECEAAPELASLIRFRVLNLVKDWPMRGQFDAIFCRNVVIYFDNPTQERLWERLARALPEGGHLFIGHSERVTGPAARLLRQVGLTTYRREPGTG